MPKLSLNPKACLRQIGRSYVRRDSYDAWGRRLAGSEWIGKRGVRDHQFAQPNAIVKQRSLPSRYRQVVVENSAAAANDGLPVLAGNERKRDRKSTRLNSSHQIN